MKKKTTKKEVSIEYVTENHIFWVLLDHFFAQHPLNEFIINLKSDKLTKKNNLTISTIIINWIS